MNKEIKKEKDSKKSSERKSLTRITKLDIQKPVKTKKENKVILKNGKASLNTDLKDLVNHKRPTKGKKSFFLFESKGTLLNQ
jgi:hypothetical protein